MSGGTVEAGDLAVEKLNTAAADRTRTRPTVVDRAVGRRPVVSGHAAVAVVAGRVVLTVAASCAAAAAAAASNDSPLSLAHRATLC